MYWFDIVWTAALVILVPLLVLALAQIARSPQLSGLGKAGWALLVLFVPFLGTAAWFALKQSRATAESNS